METEDRKANGGGYVPPIVEVLPPAAPGGGLMVPGQVAMQVRGTYATAVQVQRPRVLADVERRLLEEANLMGEGAYYGWGAGKDKIEGPSQELAFAAARCWGNNAIEYEPIQETSDSYIFTAAIVDLETGFTMQRPFRQSKNWTVHGKLDPERKADVRFQIGATKAARNVILKFLPGWLIDKAMERAKEGVRARIEAFIEKKGLPAAQDLCIAELAKVGVKEELILAKFSVADRKALDVEKMVILRGDLKAIQSGSERASELFPAPGTNGEPERGSIDPSQLKPKATEAAAEPATPASAPTPALDDGPPIFTAEKRASLVAHTEKAMGCSTTEAMKILDDLCADLAGASLEKTPASFETTILRSIEKFSKNRPGKR